MYCPVRQPNKGLFWEKSSRSIKLTDEPQSIRKRLVAFSFSSQSTWSTEDRVGSACTRQGNSSMITVGSWGLWF